MVNTAESKQDQSRHFGLNKLKARSSTSVAGKEIKRPALKKPLTVPSRHISRKDLFYGLHTARNGQPNHSVRRKQVPSPKVAVRRAVSARDFKISGFIGNNKIMHPEHVQLASPVEGLIGEKILKPQEAAEDEIDVEDVEEVDNGDLNGGAKEELNGNGFHHKENGHSQLGADKNVIIEEEKVQFDTNGAEIKPVLRLKSSRRNSTSSRSSSVSSAPSLKQQTPLALQMEVSMDDEERDLMEPLIIEGNAEDLEVSMSASHDDDGDDGITTDSETIADHPHDPYEFDDDDFGNEQAFDTELLKKSRSSKSAKGAKVTKSSKPKAIKAKSPRSKPLKVKGSKQSPKLSEQVLDEFDAEYSDTNSLSKEDNESEDLNTKSQKSPTKRSKSNTSKQELADEGDVDVKGGDAELAPRRSSRSRQTPQKYNSSLYADWDHHLLSDDRMNSSDAVTGTSIRSVKGRRSLRKSRNISALNSSLHNESSPWDNDFKVLTPCGGGLSIHNETVADNVDSSTPLKRKAIDEDFDEENERGQKKMCVENTDLDNSTTSQSSSFFSIITSPIAMLKNKLRGSSVSSSTPIRPSKVADDVEPVLPADNGNEEKIEVKPEEEIEEDGAASVQAEVAPVGEAQEAKSWCTIM